MRIWCDTTIMPFIKKDRAREIIATGNVLVFSNTAVDVKLLRDNFSWTENMLLAEAIVIELWNSLDEMVRKPFYWSSFDVETPASLFWSFALLELPEPTKVFRLGNLVKQYGIPRGQWQQGEWTPPVPITTEDAVLLGINPETATRTEILAAAKKCGNLEAYSRYNVGYCMGLARQHMCDGILNADGSISNLS